MFLILAPGFNIESESNDRLDITLPGKQSQLLQDAASAAVQGKYGVPPTHKILNAKVGLLKQIR